jgi:isopenicillin-N epimerase
MSQSETSAKPSRRQFVGRFSGAVVTSAAVGSNPLAAQIPVGANSKLMDEAYWTFLSKQFLLESGLTYLNAGTTGAMPRPVFDAEVRYQRMLAENPKIRHLFEYVVLPYQIRRKAAAVLGADLEETALTHNTTEGLNIVAHGLPLKAGDQVIITDQEHPGHLEAWRLRSKRDNIDVVQVKIPSPLPDSASFLKLIDGAITSRTKVIAVPHIATTTGLITPAKQVCDLARSKNILCLLDGAHGAGQIKLNVKELGCDFYATSPHKWLHAPLGNGIFYVRREMQERLWPLVGGGGWDIYRDARKYSTFGNRAWSTAMALGDAIDFANAIGIEKIEVRQRELMTYFKRKLLTFDGVEPLTPNDPTMYCAQSAFRIPKLDNHGLADTLREKHGIIVGEKTDGFRIDIGYYITKPQLDNTLAVFERLISKRAS